MPYNIEPYDPIRDSNLVQPLDTREFSSNWINYLYKEEQLTQDEYLVLDYFGATTQLKEGEVTMSFQGLKRQISLHQAKLTKAINRLVSKNLLIKVPGGYTLTEQGSKVFWKLHRQFQRSATLPKLLFSHVSQGQIQGPPLTDEQYQQIASGLIGKWFGQFRFTSKIDYMDSFELAWITTDGSSSASLIVGPGNKLRLTLSAPRYTDSGQLHMLVNHLSQNIESLIDAPVVFSNISYYENRQKLEHEILATHAG